MPVIDQQCSPTLFSIGRLCRFILSVRHVVVKLDFFMSSAASRLLLGRTKFVTRQTALRHASTTSEAAQAASDTATKSKDAASNIASKASQGLERVQSSAGPALSRALERVNGALGRIGGRTGRIINFGTCKWMCF